MQWAGRVLGAQGEDIGVLRLFLVTRVTEEHQLAVVFPLWKIEVFRTTRFVGADCLVFTLEDGSQVPELSLYVFH